jgi:hypothetical protein
VSVSPTGRSTALRTSLKRVKFVAPIDMKLWTGVSSRRVSGVGRLPSTRSTAPSVFLIPSSWKGTPSAVIVPPSAIVGAITGDGGLVRVDASLIATTRAIAIEHGLPAYAAAYVAAARAAGADLVSCYLRDLVSRGLAVTPSAAV